MDQPRYALLTGLHAVALCHDVDGLYGDPVPPPRIRHELRGCEPRGALARAVTEAIIEGTAPLGTLDVETPDGAWRLTAVRVLGARGDAVTVESAGPPARLHGAYGAVPCGNLVRVSPAPPRDLTHTEITFLGCSPRGALRDALAAGAPGPEPVRYQVLNRMADLQYEAAAGPVTAAVPSRRHHGLLDLTVSFPRAGLLPPQHREVWDLFHDHDPPAAPGTWRRFTGPARAAWLTRAARHGHRAPQPVPGAAYELDGRGVTDDTAFLCALGEAVLGPGRALATGAPRALGAELSGCVLVWHHSAVARACLGVTPLLVRPRPATFQEYVDGLRAEGVRVDLA
ncbi:hypothetical protein ACIQRS_07705 [Streptomyces termitum]|uniref:Uncharacterized protein n=1 Tax=Streptomyces termitum TaxID=67368 RepID=A0A918W432_9ACTN|nr:hypothetical protein [Streptomyces termitum]GHA65589.1 hypothetical protein GCM10010305_04210 [Streptomyces termitum]